MNRNESLAELERLPNGILELFATLAAEVNHILDAEEAARSQWYQDAKRLREAQLQIIELQKRLTEAAK